LYQHRVSDMTCDNLVGYVSPNKVKDYLTLTTGINLSQTNDNMNQCYKTHSDGDLFIVGRGIYDGDSLQNVKRYQHYYNTLV